MALNFFKERYTRAPLEDAPAVPTGGVKLYLYLMKTYFSRMVALNLLFVLCCLPLVTIPAALAGLSRVCMRLVRDGYCLLWAEFWQECKQAFFRRLGIYLLLMGVPLALAQWGRILGSPSLYTGILIAAYAISFLLQCYYFPLIAMLDLPPRVNLGNAFSLMMLAWKQTLLLLATIGIPVCLCLFFFPYSAIVPLLIGVSAGQLWICTVVNPQIDKRLVKEDTPGAAGENEAMRTGEENG